MNSEGHENSIDQYRLAVDRTVLAYDRTLMAWVRTSISLISFGFTVYKFFQFLEDRGLSESEQRWIGPREFSIMLITLGNVGLILATVQYMWVRRVICKEYRSNQNYFVAIFAFVTAIFGILLFLITILRV
jgi:putative membrane protein